MGKGSVKSPVSTGNKGLPPNMPSGGKGSKSPTESGNKGIPPMKGPKSYPAPRD